MRIGIDAKMFENSQYTGIPWYVNEIMRSWAKQYPEHQYYLFSYSKVNIGFELPDNWHVVIKEPLFGFRKLWSIVQLPFLIKQNNLDVFWGTNYSLPVKVYNVRYYVTIYDLAMLIIKGIGDTMNEIKMRLLTKPACIKADKVFAISKATAKDIENLFGINKSKIRICYCGGLPKANPLGTVREELVLQEPFFLFISTIEPRKNIETLIRAFEKYVDETGSNAKLVLAGKRGWKSNKIYKTYDECKVQDRILMPGFISGAEKDYLLRNASAFIYPSLYEGFGIPVLEAFEYGLPTITTNVSSIPEVGGDAAFYIKNPTDVNELAVIMDQVMKNGRNEELNRKMRKQIELFSWDESARIMMETMCNGGVHE